MDERHCAKQPIKREEKDSGRHGAGRQQLLPLLLSVNKEQMA